MPQAPGQDTERQTPAAGGLPGACAESFVPSLTETVLPRDTAGCLISCHRATSARVRSVWHRLAHCGLLPAALDTRSGWHAPCQAYSLLLSCLTSDSPTSRCRAGPAPAPAACGRGWAALVGCSLLPWMPMKGCPAGLLSLRAAARCCACARSGARDPHVRRCCWPTCAAS